MEQNTSLIAKKILNIMRVALYMLKKGICKRKILMDLNLSMKRGKLVGKTLQNLMFHHHHHHNHHEDDSISKVGLDSHPKLQGEYEFSCSNTPLYQHYFTNNNKRKNQHNKKYSIDGMDNVEGVNAMFDMMMLSNKDEVVTASSPSPSLLGLGFGKSPNPNVRQLRVTDSPFPLQNRDDGNNKQVDKAADEFIKKFYSQLKQQKQHYSY